MIFPSKIEERAAKLRAGIPPPHKPPAQDYANLIEHRRRSRVAENRQMEEGVAYDNGIQKRVQLINAANERHRLEGYYRLGQVPSHILHPLIKGLTKPVVKMEVDSSPESSEAGESEDMEVDEDAVLDVTDPATGIVIEMGVRGPGKTALKGRTQPATMTSNGLPKYTDGEKAVKHRHAAGAKARRDHPEDVVSRNIKTVERNRISRKTFAETYANELANAKEKVDSTARRVAREARDLRKRTA
jgi:hypothetical protein